MKQPEDITLHLLREIRGQNHDLRGEFQNLREEFSALRDDVKRGFERFEKRLDGLRDVVAGESVLGRYAAKEVDERLVAIEERVSLLEQDR